MLLILLAMTSAAAPHAREVGSAEPRYWAHLSEAQQADAVATLKACAANAADRMKIRLRLRESRDFLLCSDLPDRDADRYLARLQRDDDKLLELFGMPRGASVWRGKALVFIFSNMEEYRLFERLVENADPGGSFAMAHCFGDGMVHLAFARGTDDAEFSHTLAHETVHGFLHRYRTPARVPSWANEGLADELASQVVPDPQRARRTLAAARAQIAKHGDSVRDLFAAEQIDGWQYPVAQTLCAFMIHHDRTGYVAFINGIKDGQTWEHSLASNYRMSTRELLKEYGRALQIKLKTSDDR